MNKTLSYSIAVLAVMIAFVGAFVVMTYRADTSLAAVGIGNEYIATSTAQNSMYGANTSQSFLIATGQGSLGTVIVSGANTGIVNFYDATTTNVSKRTGQPATSTILLFSMPASLAAGSYPIDVQFTTGLIMDLNGGNMPTTTITYRR